MYAEHRSMTQTTKSYLLDRCLAYAIFRITLGINILIHGLGRLFGPGAGGFAAKTSPEFTSTVLPHGLVSAFLTALPFAEAILGALILFGLFTRWVLALGALLIAALVFGTALRGDWSPVGDQMLYAIVYYFLLRNLVENYFSVDNLIATYQKPSRLRGAVFSGD